MRNKKEIRFGNWKTVGLAVALLGAISLSIVYTVRIMDNRTSDATVFADTAYGVFLASQHAIYVNDFEAAAKFAKTFKDVNVDQVQQTVILVNFLAGGMCDSFKDLRGESKVPLRMIYITHLIKQGSWRDVYDLYKTNDSSILAPLRIWSSVAIGKENDAMKFMGTLKNTNESWQEWTRGMVYAATGKNAKAKEHFEKVSLDFMNLNDYMYLLAFYSNTGFDDAAAELHANFTERPAGLYMLNQSINYDWGDYDGFQNALAFSLVQTVSHSATMAGSDLSLLFLRMAENIASGNKDVINYYLGLYFYINDGNYREYFDRVPKSSIYYPFVLQKYAEKAGDFKTKRKELESAIKQNPLFIPGIVKLVSLHVQNDQERDALYVLSNALKRPNVSDLGRAFFLKSRAQVHLVFGNIEAAQQDIDEASLISPNDAGILSEQARIWAASGENLDEAYAYSLALVKTFPAEVEVWDTLGRVVLAKDGPDTALTIYEKVGRVAETCSSLFENLGDIYKELGEVDGARDAYKKAISLSEDGMTVEKVLEKKLKALK